MRKKKRWLDFEDPKLRLVLGTPIPIGIPMGFKAIDLLSGPIYAPYMPLFTTPISVTPASFQPRNGVMSNSTYYQVTFEFEVEDYRLVLGDE